MGRVRLPNSLIQGATHRNEVFNRRKTAVKRKAMELGKLCDVVTLLVCFGPRNQLETWPEDAREVRRIIHQYRSLGKGDDGKRQCHYYGETSFFECHLKKLNGDLARERDSRLGSSRMTVQALEELARSLDMKLTEIDEWIAAGGKEEESRGKVIDADRASTQSQIQQKQMQEDMDPSTSDEGDGLVLQDLFRMAQSMDLSWFDAEVLGREDTDGQAATAAGSAWENPQMAATSDAYYTTPLSIADYGISVGSSIPDVDLRKPTFHPFLATDSLASLFLGTAPGDRLASSDGFNMGNVPDLTSMVIRRPFANLFVPSLVDATGFPLQPLPAGTYIPAPVCQQLEWYLRNEQLYE